MNRKRLKVAVLLLTSGAVVSASDSDVTALLKTVRNPDVAGEELTSAARQLGRTGAAEAVKPLASLLKHRNEQVRDESTLALVRIGKTSVPALVELLNDATEMPGTIDDSYTSHKYPDYAQSRQPLDWRQLGAGKLYAPVGLTVNRYAARALGLIGERTALPAIEAAEKKFAGSVWIRDEFRRARIAISGSETPPAADMRPWMLAEIGNQSAAGPLAAFISQNLRKQAGGNVAEKFGPYTDIGGNSSDAIRRIDALGVLGLAEPVAPLLRLAEEGVRNDWTWFHAGMHDLVDHYHGLGVGWDAHWMAPLAACRALGESGASAAVPALKERLTDRNIMVRLTAARALAQLADHSGLQVALDDSRWMHAEFVSDYDTKGRPWLQHWLNDDQSLLASENKYPGRTWFRLVPSYHHLVAYETLALIGNDDARAALNKRTREILSLQDSNEEFSTGFYQTDLLWLAAALKRTGDTPLSGQALKAGMQLFEGERATSVRLRHFHVAALPALAKLNDPATLDAVCRVLAHHQTSWRPGTYDIRDLAWGVYLTLDGRRDPNNPLRCSELCWLH